MNTAPEIRIHAQRCYDCRRELKPGDKAIASMDLPLAFCLECRGKIQETHPRLCRALVEDESSG